MILEPGNILDFTPPPKTLWRAVTAPLQFYFAPKSIGIENVSADKPCLLVGNHTLYGGVDWPLVMAELYTRRNVFPRSLADRAHFKVPVWRNYVGILGVVHGTRANCHALMQAGQHVLVYPGGSREICKRKGEEYKLTWKERTGFIEMALDHGYDIVPFASVGQDDTITIYYDANDLLQSSLGRALKRHGIVDKWFRKGDVIPPIGRGLGPTLLPRPERFYFKFGKPMSLKRYAKSKRTHANLITIRENVAERIETLIDELKEYREQDKELGLVRRILMSL